MHIYEATRVNHVTFMFKDSFVGFFQIKNKTFSQTKGNPNGGGSQKISCPKWIWCNSGNDDEMMFYIL